MSHWKISLKSEEKDAVESYEERIVIETFSLLKK